MFSLRTYVGFVVVDDGVINTKWVVLQLSVALCYRCGGYKNSRRTTVCNNDAKRTGFINSGVPALVVTTAGTLTGSAHTARAFPLMA